jgi:CheY-like chemotaxis protein
MMPEMDGFEFIARVRADPKHVDLPIVVVTAKTLTPEEWHRLSGQLQGLIQKGDGDKDALLAALNRLVPRRAKPAIANPS